MTERRRRSMVSRDSVPALRRHVRIRFDPVRRATAVLAPESVFWPNEIGLDILRRCDGRSTVAAIVADLAAEYDAGEEEVAADVVAFLQDWCDRLLVKL